MHTEKQTEDWLASETRDVVLADGSRRPVRMFSLSWETYDCLVALSGYTPEQIAAWALEESCLQKLSFGEAFEGVVAWLDHQRRERWGV